MLHHAVLKHEYLYALANAEGVTSTWVAPFIESHPTPPPKKKLKKARKQTNVIGYTSM